MALNLDSLQNDLKEAQLARDEIRVSTLRMLISEVKNAEIAKGGDLAEADLMSVLQKELKKRKEAALAFKNGGRAEMAEKEEKEAAILQAYLPAQLQVEELTKIIEESINEVGAKTIQDMGRVIGVVMGKVKGQADGGMVSSLVKEKLS